MILSLVIINIYLWKINSRLAKGLLGVIILLVGTYYFQLGALNWKQEKMKQYLGQKIKVEGEIVKVKPGSNHVRYILTNLNFPQLDLATDKKILITQWEPDEKFKCGTKVLLTTTLHLPSPQRNPGGFSYRAYLRRQGIYAVGEIKTEVKKVGTEASLVNSLFRQLRWKISRRINRYFQPPNSCLLQALLLGQKVKLPSKIEKTFRQIGVSHLLVISGFHLGLISYFVYWLTTWFSSGLQIIIMGVIFTVYLVITGWQLPAFRAGLLAMLTLVGQYLNRRTDLYNLLAGAAVIMLLLNPRCLFMVSFQLSLGAVVGLSYLTPILNYYLSWLPNKIREIIAATLAAQLSLLPLLSYYFNQFPVTGVIANLILMPLISLVLVGGMVFSGVSLFTVGGLKLISWGLGDLLQLTIILARWLAANLSWTVTIATPELLEIIVYYLLLYWITQLLNPTIVPYSKPYRRYLLGLSLSIILLVTINLGFINQNLQITFLGASGEAVYLHTPGGKDILLDGGKTGRTVVNFLRSQGVRKLDLVFVSHFHRDHVGGLLKVINKFKVAKILYPPIIKENQIYTSLLRRARRKNIKTIKVNQKDQLKLPMVAVEVLAPGRLLSDHPMNNNSLVLQLVYHQFNLLFTGDIERAAERKLLKFNQRLRTTVLKVPHHGSDTSSTPKLIKQLAPQLAVISVAPDNKYGHPDPEVVARFKSKGIKVLRTDTQGAVTIITDGDSYQYRTYLP